MTPCSFLISPNALWPRGQRKKKTSLLLPLPLSHFSQHSLHPRAFDLTRMMEQFKIHRAAEPAKEKHLLGWHTVSNQYLPSSPPRTCWRWWETSHLALLCCQSNQLSCVRCEQGINPLFVEESIETVYCSGSGAFFPCVRLEDKICYWM